MRLGAQPFLWKWVLFAWEWKMTAPYQRLSTYPRFEREARGNSEMAYYTILGFQKIKSKSKQENYSLLTNFGNTIPALRAYNSMSSLNAENIRNTLKHIYIYVCIFFFFLCSFIFFSFVLFLFLFFSFCHFAFFSLELWLVRLSNILILRFTVALPLIFPCVIMIIFCSNYLTEGDHSL